MSEPRDPEAETPLPVRRSGCRRPAASRDRWRVLRPLAHRDFRVLFGAVVLSIFAAGHVGRRHGLHGHRRRRRTARPLARRRGQRHRAAAVRDPGRDRRRPRLAAADRAGRSSSSTSSRSPPSWSSDGSGPVTIPQLAVVAFVLGAGAGFFFPAYSAILPRILPPQQLLAANGLEGAIRPALQQAAGPAVAGMLVAAVMVPAHAAVAIAIAHACALVLLLFLRPEPRAAASRRRGDRARRSTGPRRASSTTCARRSSSPCKTPWLLWTLLYATRLGARLRRAGRGAAAVPHPRAHRRGPALVRLPARGLRARRRDRLDRRVVADRSRAAT